MPAFVFPPTCPPFPGLPTDMSTISSSTMMSNSTQSYSNTTSASMLSAGMVLSVPNPIRESPRDGVVGPIAAPEQGAPTLSQCMIQAAAVARDVAADAADINNAHATIDAQHRKIFLARAFGINPNGVTVQCDYRAVSHSIRIVGVIYEVSKFGGARIATIAGI